MNEKQIESLKLAIARLKDFKQNLTEMVTAGTENGDIPDDIADELEEQFAEDGAGGEALAILEGLLGEEQPKVEYEWLPKIGDKVPFNEYPNGWGSSVEGTVDVLDPSDDTIRVSVPGVILHLVFERTGGSWSACGRAKRERGLRGEEPYTD